MAMEDILYIKKKGLHSFSLQAFPEVKRATEDGVTHREGFSISVKCETTEQRDSWINEMNVLIPSHLEPIEGEFGRKDDWYFHWFSKYKYR